MVSSIWTMYWVCQCLSHIVFGHILFSDSCFMFLNRYLLDFELPWSFRVCLTLLRPLSSCLPCHIQIHYYLWFGFEYMQLLSIFFWSKLFTIFEKAFFYVSHLHFMFISDGWRLFFLGTHHFFFLLFGRQKNKKAWYWSVTNIWLRSSLLKHWWDLYLVNLPSLIYQMYEIFLSFWKLRISYSFFPLPNQSK